MKKRYLSLLLAVFMLLGQIAGTGPLAYASEVTGGEGQEEPGGTTYEPNFWIGEEIHLLPGWEHEISKWDSGEWFVKDEAHPEGANLPMEITEVALTQTDGSVELEETEDGWKLKAENMGRNHIVIKGKIAEGEGDVSPDYATRIEQIEADVVVSDKVYSLGIRTDKGTSCLLPGESIHMYADISLECWSEREGHYPGDISDVSVCWNIESEYGSGEEIDEGKGYKIYGPELEEDYDISVRVRVMAGGEEVVNESHQVYVRNQYYVLEPEELEGAEDIWPGGEGVTVVPQVFFYKKGEVPAEEKNVQYRFDYNSDNFSIKKDGNVVGNGSEETEGTFTIARLQNSDDRVRIEAYLEGEEGLEQCCDREWYFHWKEYEDIKLEGSREEDYSWIYIDDGDTSENDEEKDRTFKLNTSNLGGNYTVDWEVGIGEGDQDGNFPFAASEDTYHIDGDTVVIDGVKMKADIRRKLQIPEDNDSNVGFNLRAIVKVGGEEQSRRDMWVEIRKPEYRLEDDEEGDVLLGTEFIYENGEIGCYVENKDHPYGEDVKLELASLEILEQYPDEGIERAVFEIRMDGKDICLAAQNYGWAKLGYQVKFSSGKEKMLIREKAVTDNIYRFNVWSSTKTTCLLPEAELELESEVWHGHYEESTGERKWEILEPGNYTVKYQDYDENFIIVDARGTIKANEEYGETGLNAIASIPQAEGDPYECWEWIPIYVTDRYYQVSAEDMTAEPGEKVNGVKWEWNKFDLEHRAGVLEPAEGSYRIEEAEGIQVNTDGTGFTVNADTPDGEKIEVWLTAEKQGAEGEVIRESGSFVLNICKHNFTQKSLKPATCTEAGSRILECSKCHTATRTETIPEAGHKAGEWVTVKAATCTEAGAQEQKCMVCGKVVDTKEIAKTEHSFGEWKETAKATALKQGTQSRICKTCNTIETRTTDKLKATIKLNVKKIPLQVKKSTTAVKVVSMTEGDAIHSWKSSNKKVASVTSKGKITGKKAGTAKITVTLKSGISASVTVKVQKKAVTTTKLSVTGKSVNKNKITLKKGKSQVLVVARTPVTSTDKVTYKSSNKKVATVSGKGKITAKKAGKAKITVSSGKKKVVITVTVKK